MLTFIQYITLRVDIFEFDLPHVTMVIPVVLISKTCKLNGNVVFRAIALNLEIESKKVFRD